MGALASNGYAPEKAVVMAVNAGVDCIMISEKRILKPAKILYKNAVENPEFKAKIGQAVRRIQRYKLNAGLLQLADDGKGGYVIEAVCLLDDSEERLNQFNKAKQNNTEFYQQYFVK